MGLTTITDFFTTNNKTRADQNNLELLWARLTNPNRLPKYIIYFFITSLLIKKQELNIETEETES